MSLGLSTDLGIEVFWLNVRIIPGSHSVDINFPQETRHLRSCRCWRSSSFDTYARPILLIEYLLFTVSNPIPSFVGDATVYYYSYHTSLLRDRNRISIKSYLKCISSWDSGSHVTFDVSKTSTLSISLKCHSFPSHVY